MVEERVSRQCLLSRKCLRFGVTPEWTSWPSGYFCPGLARSILGLRLLYVLCNVQAGLCRMLGHVCTNVRIVLTVFGPAVPREVCKTHFARVTANASTPHVVLPPQRITLSASIPSRRIPSLHVYMLLSLQMI